MKVGEEDGSTSTAMPAADDQRAASVSSAPSAAPDPAVAPTSAPFAAPDLAVAPTLAVEDAEVPIARMDSKLVHCPSFEDESKEALLSQARSDWP